MDEIVLNLLTKNQYFQMLKEVQKKSYVAQQRHEIVFLSGLKHMFWHKNLASIRVGNFSLIRYVFHTRRKFSFLYKYHCFIGLRKLQLWGWM